MKLRKVTVWKRYHDATRKFLHNHIEDGWVPAAQQKPNGKDPEKYPAQHREWQGTEWVKYRTYLDARGRVVL